MLVPGRTELVEPDAPAVVPYEEDVRATDRARRPTAQILVAVRPSGVGRRSGATTGSTVPRAPRGCLPSTTGEMDRDGSSPYPPESDLTAASVADPYVIAHTVITTACLSNARDNPRQLSNAKPGAG